MPIEFNCESCSKLLRVPDGSGGKQCLCPGCSKVLNIPHHEAKMPVVVEACNDGARDITICLPCPKCKHELICEPRLVGTKGQCRSCKHIFVISDLPANAAQALQPSIHWVFSCPKCSQLFEGTEAMRGRRGICHACGEVFAIELRVADQPLANAVEASSKPAMSLKNSFDDELTLGLIPDESQPKRASKPAPKQPTSTGKVVSKVLDNDIPPIQFNCMGCSGRLEVPGAAARQLTHCPHCKRQLTVPIESEPTPEGLAANDAWADFVPLGSAPAPIPQSNPFGDTLYPLPMPMSSMPMSSMTSGAGRRSGDKRGLYITCGVFISICAFLGMAMEIFYIAMATILLMRPNVDRLSSSVQIFVLSVMFVLSLLQLVGGISLARRSGLLMARTGAILCCLPCICLINIPFGVWGCILAFGKDAERDFR